MTQEERAIVVILDDDDRYGPYIFLSPAGMNLAVAITILNGIVETLKDDKPNDYQWTDLVARSKEAGFEEAEWLQTNRRW